ncbi:hypothetical protein SUGI_0438580 [Cryptomeria japonica]|nr:hypothetical protein SUGI_0438580 [Cryptomeria japonica]
MHRQLGISAAGDKLDIVRRSSLILSSQIYSSTINLGRTFNYYSLSFLRTSQLPIVSGLRRQLKTSEMLIGFWLDLLTRP